MHAEAMTWLRRQADQLPLATTGQDPPGVVLEFGSRDINGNVRGLFPARERYVGVDLYPGPGVDEVGDVRGLHPDAGLLADLIVCAETLEHCEDWRGIIAAAHRNLRPGGVLLLTAAADPRAPHSGLDGGPVRDGEWYGNIDPAELDTELKAFTERTVEWHPHGDVYARAVR